MSKKCWHYVENQAYIHISWVSMKELFLGHILSSQWDLYQARKRAKLANESLKAAKDNLTICFRKYPHSDIVLMAKERYHRAKQEWKEASDKVISARYILAESFTAYNMIRELCSKEVLEMPLYRKHKKKEKK